MLELAANPHTWHSSNPQSVVELHADGWAVKSIAGFLKTSETTVYRTLKRWAEEGVESLEDKPHGRPRGNGKVTFPIMNKVRLMQENPRLGAFRVHAAFEPLRAGQHDDLLFAVCLGCWAWEQGTPKKKHIAFPNQILAF